MITHRTVLPISVLVMFFFLSCSQPKENKKIKPEKAFYFWKTVFNLSGPEKKTLAALDVKTLYLKFFDVDWDNNSLLPRPVAQLIIKDAAYLKDSVNMIPVVFITNSCIRHIDSSQAEVLGVKIATLVNAICTTNLINFYELQLDCDWTEQTKKNYFILLRSIRKHQPIKKLSATIRLYQIKYRNKAGVPPVDRGLLMAYNMGNLKDLLTRNSILDSRELKKYTAELSSYPLPLDIGLPLFEWKVLFRNNSYTGLIENLPDSFLNNPAVTRLTKNRYRFIRDTVLNGYVFNNEDVIRKEDSEYDEILSAEKILAENINGTKLNVSLFHLDSLILKKYTTHELENIFNGLR